MSNIKRINVGERMSQVVIYNGLVFTAGQVASSAPNKDVGEQTKNVFKTIFSSFSPRHVVPPSWIHMSPIFNYPEFFVAFRARNRE